MATSPLSQRSLPVGDALYLPNPAAGSITRAVELGLNVVVTGASGVGKTTIVRQALIGEEQPPQGRLVWVEGDGCSVHDLPDRLLEAFGWSPPTYETRLRSEVSGVMGVMTERVPIEPDPRTVDRSDVEFLGRTVAEAPEVLEHDPGDKPWLVVVDGPHPLAFDELWGKFRELLWQMPVQWIVLTTRDPLPSAANVFFEAKTVVGDLDDETAHQLVVSRLEATGKIPTRQASTIADSIVGNVPNRPRDLITAARDTLLGDEQAESRYGRYDQLSQAAQRLGRPQAMLMAEIIAAGGASASDEELQQRLGYSRSRLAQLLDDMVNKNLLVRERQGRRMIFKPTETLP